MKAIVTLMFLVLLAAGCASESETGEECAATEDCAEGTCITGGSFPDGTCTPSCSADADCPDGFRCISRSSGICLRECSDDAQCESERGSAWQCREESLEDGDGNAMVCIGD